MAKFYGKIGFAITDEQKPGVWKEVVTEKYYFGDVSKNIKRYQTGDGLNDDLDIVNQIAIVADPFANENFRTMRYIEFMGAKWKINSVEVQHPRLILSIGGVYNGGQKNWVT